MVLGKDSGFRRARPVLRELSANQAQGLLMPLSLRERLTMLMPPSVFYRQRIAQEARTGEPELAVLAELVPRGGIAVDVGANRLRARCSIFGRNTRALQPSA